MSERELSEAASRRLRVTFREKPQAAQANWVRGNLVLELEAELDLDNLVAAVTGACEDELGSLTLTGTAADKRTPQRQDSVTICAREASA
jgi:hypothetical protein